MSECSQGLNFQPVQVKYAKFCQLLAGLKNLNKITKSFETLHSGRMFDNFIEITDNSDNE